MRKMPVTEKCVVWALGLILATVGWQGVRGFDGYPPKAAPLEFDFLRGAGGGQRVGDTEYFFGYQCFVSLDGVGGVENARKSPFRHGLGPATRLVLRPEGAGVAGSVAQLTMHFYNGVEGQNLVVRYDGQPLETLRELPLGTIKRTYRLPLTATPAGHEFRLEYERWNRRGIVLTDSDDRAMAGSFNRLEIDLE